jgi:hypothetical protein
MEDEERRKARAAEEAAQRGQAEEEIAFKRATARTAESDAKQADIDAQKAIADKPRLEAAVKDSGDLLERAKNNLQGLEGNLAEAKANGFAGQAVPAIRVGMDKGELDRRNMIIAADEALKFAQGQVDRQKAVIEDQEKRHSQLTIEEAQNEGAIERLTRRAIEMGRLADETKRAADEEERLQAIRDRSQSNIDAKADETALVRRRNALQEKINSGTATPDEQSEYSGATDTGVSHRIADTQRRITDIQNNIRLEGGRASAQEVAALVKLNDYLVGLLENVHGVTNRNESDIQSLMSRVQSLEDHGHIDRMGR